MGLLVKSSGADEMSGLIEAQPDVYYWPKYYGASGWLGIKLNRRRRRLGAGRRIGSSEAGSLRRRGGCWKLAGDERIP